MPDKDVMVQIKAIEEQRGWSAFDVLAKAEAEGDADPVAPFAAALADLAESFRTLADLYDKARMKGARTSHVVPLRNAAFIVDTVAEQLRRPRRAPLGQVQPISSPPSVTAPRDLSGLDALIADSVAAGRGTLAERLSDTRAQIPVATHRFEVGDDGRTCKAGVERMGYGDFCGLLPAHPVHTPPQVKIEVNGEDVTAYLRGDVDSIPGLPDDPGPSSVRDQTAGALERPQPEVPQEDPPSPDGEPIQPEEGPDVSQTSAPPPSPDSPPPPPPVPMLGGSGAPAPSPSVPPVPMLGQPGDMGSGYSHSYVPPGGVRATFAELLTLVPVDALPAHISHSQIETVGECSTKYRLQRLTGRPGGDVVEIPQWALIGGQAFHAVIEEIERVAQLGDPDPLHVIGHNDAESAWNAAFDAEITKVEASQPVPRSRWRASKQGAEGETWWRVNGPEMIRRYLAARPDQPTANLPLPGDQHGAVVPAIEYEVEVKVPTPYGAIPYHAILDRVTIAPQDPGSNWQTLVIRDYKSGASMPGDVAQLGEYAQALRLAGVPPQVKILGTFFNARKGTWTEPVDLEAAGYTAEWFAYVVTTGHAQRLALTTGPTPARPSSFCGGCPVRWACPVKAMAK